jgi:hypothetical protein
MRLCICSWRVLETLTRASTQPLVGFVFVLHRSRSVTDLTTCVVPEDTTACHMIVRRHTCVVKHQVDPVPDTNKTWQHSFPVRCRSKSKNTTKRAGMLSTSRLHCLIQKLSSATNIYRQFKHQFLPSNEMDYVEIIPKPEQCLSSKLRIILRLPATHFNTC